MRTTSVFAASRWFRLQKWKLVSSLYPCVQRQRTWRARPSARFWYPTVSQSVSGGMARNLGLPKQFHVNVKGLLHTAYATVLRWSY